jgi:uncharacterized membrane protein YbhN (UPF0104 family)
VESFLETLWDTLTSVSIPLLLLGIAFQTVQTVLVALAWRNILRASWPDGGDGIRYRNVLGYYAGGCGLNSFLPASAGTVAMLGLYRTNIKGATVAGLVGATVVENIFFGIMAAIVYGYLFIEAAGSFDVKFGWFSSHWALTLVILVAGTALTALVLRMLWHKLQHTWNLAKDGGVIVRQPRRFMREVVAVEAASYVARMGVNATFMYAYNIPVSVKNVFLIVAASSISSTVALAPGAVGAQTALANVALAGVATQAEISAYSISQSVITTAWSAVFGLTMLARTIGWDQTKKLMHTKKKKEEEQEQDGAEPSADATAPEGAVGP